MDRLSAHARLTATVLLLAAAVLLREPQWLVLQWLTVCWGLQRAGLLAVHARLTLAFILPLAAGVMVIQTAAADGEGLAARATQGALAAATVAGRAAVVAAALQACFGPILGDGRLVGTLRRLRLSEDLTLVVLAAITLISDVRVRVRQVQEARAARGLAGRSAWQRVVQLPSLALPLMVYVLDSASQRAEFWGRRDLRARLATYVPQEDADRAETAAWLVLGGFWLAFGLINLLKDPR